MIKLLLVEDQKLLLDGLAISLSQEFSVCGKLTSAKDVMTFLKKPGNEVDILLADICTGEANSLDVIKPAKALMPKLKVILMTGIPEISFIKKAKEVGVDSFIYKNISFEEMSLVIKATNNNYHIFPDSKTTSSVQNIKDLDDRELEILRMYCGGMDKKEIAQKLAYSESTIKQCIRSMLDKTGFDTINHLAIFAVSNRYVVPEMK
ncbi:MAG: response regulator transcription factor [Bacilli bacterium]|jgi:DNA-binding NarL/FixJ family response regulator|nr:response regulator transcription factor [Bacilli bacterium]